MGFSQSFIRAKARTPVKQYFMKPFTGTTSLIRFILKRDKISLLCWIVILPLLPVLSVSAIAKLYTDTASLQAIIASVDANPLEVSMFGHMLAPNLGAIMCWKWLMQSAIFLGIFNLFFVIKHTRGEEASGRYELLSATAIGRFAMISATLVVAFIANFLIGLCIMLYLYAYGLPLEGSMALFVSAWGMGFFMAALSAFVAQLTQEASAAKGIMGVLLAAFYMLNIVGNSGMEEISWLSPISWLYKMRPYADENWAIVLLLIVSSAVLSIAAYYLLGKRDVGTGFLQQKDRIHRTSPYLNNGVALAWKLHKKMIFWWSFSFLIMGALCGAIMDSATVQVGDNIQFKAILARMGGTNIGDMMFNFMLLFFAQAFAAYAILATGKLQTEEIDNRSDMVLSLAIGRNRWAISHLGVIIFGMILICFSFGASAGICYGMTNDAIGYEFGRLISASFAFLPALFVMSTFAFLVFALSPKHFYLSWLLLIFIVSLDFIGALVPDLEKIAKFSPFTHVPKILLGETEWMNLVWLSLIALFLGVLGLFFYRKRDLV